MNDVDDIYEAECTDHEINMILDQIKEEFFDNRIRMYKLTKFGLIKLLPYIKTEKTLEFLQTIKRESTVLIEDDEIIKHLERFSRINITNTNTNEHFTRVLKDVSTKLIKGTRVFIFSRR